MDILIRLRLALWLLVLCLWGMMIRQFLEEEGPALPSMQWVQNPSARKAPGEAAGGPSAAAGLFPPKPAPEPALPEPPASALLAPATPLTHPPPASTLPPAPDRGLTHSVPPAGRKIPLPTLPEPPASFPEPTTPQGFVRTQTPHFTVLAETEPPAGDLMSSLETLHANLMLDLAAFSPWARDQRVTIYLFRSQSSYRKVTGRPSWSGGASSVRRRKIYLYESEELMGILAHELCHIYFDGFFLDGQSNPLWLSEGMATLVQTERGLAAPNWLRDNLDILRRGGGYAITDLVRVENTAGATDADVRLWYTQAYSVVRFLIRSQYKSSFYRFCKHLREGSPLAEGLYRSYGMPFNRVKALEYAWRYDLAKR